MRAVLVWVLVLSANSGLEGQVSSRAGEIEEARRNKSQVLKPDDPDKIERILLKMNQAKVIERITQGIAGLRIVLGGLVTGSGFALGPEYYRRDLASGRVMFRASSRASISLYQLHDVEFSTTDLASRRVFARVYAVHRDLPRMQYYGPGPDSLRSGRTSYRMEDTNFSATAGLRPVRKVRLGATGGYLLINVGRGRHPRFASADATYTPQQTPGIDRQTRFLTGAVFAEYDWRDNPGGPRRGGNYTARLSYFGDRQLSRHTFRRLDAELQQYVPFFNERRVIALRARTSLSYVNPGQIVPFYLQTIVGGSDDVRGFRPFRFYDDHSLVLNGEYRWEVFSGLDMALFADAGKVFPRRGQLNFSNLESSVGFGFRANVRNHVFLRVDVGFSHEGFMVWFKFNNVF